MPLSFQIVPEIGMVYVRYWGSIRVEETDRSFQEYLAHPDYKPGQKQFVDLSRMTDYHGDYLKIMKLQSRKADAFSGLAASRTIVVYLAPTAISHKVARIVQKSWDGVDRIHPLIALDEDQALALLGFEGQNLADLLNPAEVGG